MFQPYLKKIQEEDMNSKPCTGTLVSLCAAVQGREAWQRLQSIMLFYIISCTFCGKGEDFR